MIDKELNRQETQHDRIERFLKEKCNIITKQEYSQLDKLKKFQYRTPSRDLYQHYYDWTNFNNECYRNNTYRNFHEYIEIQKNIPQKSPRSLYIGIMYKNNSD